MANQFTRRGVLGGLVGAAGLATAGPALAQKPAPGQPDPAAALKAMEQEAFKNLKGLYTAQKSYFAERDRYSTDLDQVGFLPEEWCEDGARLKIKEKSTSVKKVGCHFIYEVETLGTDASMQFRAYARGAVAPALGLTYLVESSGEFNGIPRRNPK